MKKPLKALIHHDRIGDKSLSVLANFILVNMTGNAHFTNPLPSLPDFAAITNTFTQALTEAATRDTLKVAVKNTVRRQLLQAMRQLGMYVNNVCVGNEEMLVSSGFPLSKPGQHHYLQNATSFAVQRGTVYGSVVSSIKSEKAALGYVHQVSAAVPGAQPAWVNFTSSRSKHIYTDLTAGQRYIFRIIIMGSNNQQVTTDVVELVA